METRGKKTAATRELRSATKVRKDMAPASMSTPPTATRSISTRATTTTNKRPGDRLNASQESEPKSSRALENASHIKKVTPKAASKATPAVIKRSWTFDDNDREPIKAYLRIRPHPQDEHGTPSPYLTALSDSVVQMTDPSAIFLPPNNVRYRPTPATTTANYTFTQVFKPDTQQSAFFQRSTLPLIHNLLSGESALLYAYGVTNSGKTYTIQGGAEQGDAGLLPRSIDVVFNSIAGLQSDRPLRPSGVASVEVDHTASEQSRAGILDNFDADTANEGMYDDTTLDVDRNHEYAVWVSYTEVYNEKIYDLLSPTALNNSRLQTAAGISSLSSLAVIPATVASTPPGITIIRKALPLKNDPEGGKYVAGQREIRVYNAAEAKAVMQVGILNRRVFGTLANSRSSRSHSVFTIKVARVHRASADHDLDQVSCARLSICDLAGSERVANAGTSGESDRIREAGNINKSLMVLGQCLSSMRINQKRIAHNSPRLAVVPFRHSKITELFQDFFVGDGRVVMIVNVNPYDTGFEENSNVMKFAAVAREVMTNVVAPRAKSIVPVNVNSPRATPTKPRPRRVMVSLGGKQKWHGTTVVEVVEEEDCQEMEGPDPDDAEGYPLVEQLFSYIEELELKLYQAELRCAMIESETREEVAQEMEAQMEKMEKMYSQRLQREVEATESKADKKLDLLRRTGVITGPSQTSRLRASGDTGLDGSNGDHVKADSDRSVSPSLDDAGVHEDLSGFVAGSATESRFLRSPDLTVNPIMDMEHEDEAFETDVEEDEEEEEEEEDEEDEEEDEEGDRDRSGPTSSGEDASYSVAQEDDEDDEDDVPNLSLPTHASFVSSSSTLSMEYGVKASRNKEKGRVVENSEDELDLIASPAKQGGTKKAPTETSDVTSIREKLQGVSLEAPLKRITRSRLKK